MAFALIAQIGPGMATQYRSETTSGATIPFKSLISTNGLRAIVSFLFVLVTDEEVGPS